MIDPLAVLLGSFAVILTVSAALARRLFHILEGSPERDAD